MENLSLDLIENLPSFLKTKILENTTQETQNIVLNNQISEEELEAVKFTNSSKPEKLKFFSYQDLCDLEEKGFILKEDFLDSDELLAQINNEVSKFYDSGELREAGLNRNDEYFSNTQFRGDRMKWLKQADIQSTYDGISKVLEKIELLKNELNDCCDFGCQKTQSQLACYPGNGSHYVRHIDSFKGGPDRRITVLYYINEKWSKEKGGCLRIFEKEGENEKNIDIEPLSNRLVIFQSRLIEHEVLPCYFKRFAITTWFY